MISDNENGWSDLKTRHDRLEEPMWEWDWDMLWYILPMLIIGGLLAYNIATHS